MIETMADVFVNAACKALLVDLQLPADSQTLTAQAEKAGTEFAVILRRLDRVAHIYLGHGDPLLEAVKQKPQNA